MIAPMVRVRIAGPRALLDRTLTTVQDLGVLHVDRPPVRESVTRDRALARQRRHVERILTDVETALARLQVPMAVHRPSEPAACSPEVVRRARRVRRSADALTSRRSSLEDERALLVRYREFFQVFAALAGHELTWPDGQAFYLVLKTQAETALPDLEVRLETAVGGEVELLSRELSSGEWAVLVLASARAAPNVAALLSASRVEELPPPPGLGRIQPLGTLPGIKTRIAEIDDALQALDDDRKTLVSTEGGWLSGVRAFLRDALLRFEARSQVFAAEYLFVLEGWLPAPRLPDLEEHLGRALGPEVTISVLGAEAGTAESDAAPVTLHNPPLFRPFEVLTRMLPLPKYGSIDPTPFVAIFFPAFFGLMVGDVGYGLMLAVLAGVLWLKSKPETTRRSVATVGLACSSSATAFGVLFGEFFGPLGRAIGLHPFFDRQEATVPFLALAVALGGAATGVKPSAAASYLGCWC